VTDIPKGLFNTSGIDRAFVRGVYNTPGIIFVERIVKHNLTEKPKNGTRRCFVGGSDARIILGEDEEALLRLWREKRGEAEPADLSSNLVVQLGIVTEDLNRRWYEASTGQVITDVQQQIRHPV
jgi:predicted phage-related endonuclease